MSRNLSGMRKILNLEQLSVAVSDLALMSNFYVEVLGMRPLLKEKTLSLFIGQLHNLKIIAFPTVSRNRHLRSIPEFMDNPCGYDHIVFEVDNIAYTQQQFEDKGVKFEVVMELELPEGGLAKVARFKDPEGNLIGLQQVTTPTSSSTHGSILKLDNIGIAVQNIAAIYHFYVEVLGMETNPLPPGASFFLARFGTVKLAVFQTSDQSSGINRNMDNFVNNQPGYDNLIFRVDDLDAMLAHLTSKGVSVNVQEVQLPEGSGRTRVARFRDPEGNVLGLQQQSA